MGLSTPRERKFTGLLDNLVVERTHFSPLNKRNKKAFDLNRLKQVRQKPLGQRANFFR